MLWLFSVLKNFFRLLKIELTTNQGNYIFYGIEHLFFYQKTFLRHQNIKFSPTPRCIQFMICFLTCIFMIFTFIIFFFSCRKEKNLFFSLKFEKKDINLHEKKWKRILLKTCFELLRLEMEWATIELNALGMRITQKYKKAWTLSSIGKSLVFYNACTIFNVPVSASLPYFMFNLSLKIEGFLWNLSSICIFSS